MAMFNPPHPGRLIYIQFIKDEDGNAIDSVANVAACLGVHRSTLNRVLSQKTALSPEMAIALEKIGGGSAEYWLGMQTDYDLFQLRSAA